MRAEYDFACMKGGVRGRYLKQYSVGTNLVLLEEDVAAAFPTEKAVNQALRAVINAVDLIRRKRRRLHNALQPTPGRRARGRGKPRVARRG